MLWRVCLLQQCSCTLVRVPVAADTILHTLTQMRLHNYRRLYTTRWDLMCNVVIWRRWLCFSSQRSAIATATTTTPPPLTKKAELTPRRLRWGLTHIIIYLFIYFTPSVALELFCKGNTEYSPKKPDAHSHHHYAHAHTHTIVVSQPHARARTHTQPQVRAHTLGCMI